METVSSNSNLNFNSCDTEPIHLIASIQDVGFLISYDLDTLKVQNISENLPKYLGIPLQHAVGKNLNEILPDAWVRDNTMTLKKIAANDKPMHLQSLTLADGVELDCYFYFSDGLGVLEFETSRGSKFSGNLTETVNEILNEIRSAPDMKQAAKALANGVRYLTDLDRVMIYRFLPKIWHGEVLAESRVASAHSFDGLRFPASDIPKPARDLYLRNRVRFIHDARRDISRLYPAKNTKTGKTLDLQDSRLRAVSPFHLEYLKNMGVISSFSVAIIVDEQLWGLIACHHLSPLEIPYHVRSGCELMAQAYALRVQSEEKLLENQKRLKFDSLLRDFVGTFRNQREPLKNFLNQHAVLRELFRANGIAVILGDQVDIVGLTPTVKELKEIAKFVDARMNSSSEDVFHTTSLSTLNSQWEYLKTAASGLLAVRISKIPGEYLMVFRPEIIQELLWGGDPTKALQKRDYPGPINPRKSFETWRETINGHSTDWEDFELSGAQFLQQLIFETFIPQEQMIVELNEKLLKRK